MTRMLDFVLMIRRSQQYWLSGDIKMPSTVSPSSGDKVKGAIQWWDSTWRLKYLSYRHRLREIAEATHSANRFDQTVHWSNREALCRLATGSWIVPLDEDDWLHPELVPDLRKQLLTCETNVYRWGVLRRSFQGKVSANPNSFVESCGYAVRSPVQWQWLVDHMSLPATHILMSPRAVRNETVGSLGVFINNSREEIMLGLHNAIESYEEEDFPEPFRIQGKQLNALYKDLWSSAVKR